MSYPILTNKQVVVLETLAAMDKSSTGHTSWSMAWVIRIHPQNCQYWDATIAQSSMEKSVAGILGSLKRNKLVESYFSGPDHGRFKMWYLSPLGNEVAG